MNDIVCRWAHLFPSERLYSMNIILMKETQRTENKKQREDDADM